MISAFWRFGSSFLFLIAQARSSCPSNGFVRQENVLFHRLQQLHRCRSWIDVEELDELRTDSFYGGRPPMSSMIFPSRNKLACGVAHCVRAHTQD